MRIRNTFIAASMLAALTLTGCTSPAASPSPTPTSSAQTAFLTGFKLVQPTATGTDEEIIAFGNAVCAKIADPSNTAIELDLEDAELQPVIELAESTICP